MAKKWILAAALVLTAGAAMAQSTTPTANATEVRLRNPANTGTIIYYAEPAAGQDQLLTYVGATNGPVYSKLGTGLSRSSDTLNVSLTAADISGTTATGQALMTAASATVARTAIGAGTSSFSGSYNDLTDKPTIPGGQVNSDWNATSGAAQILNKPTFFDGQYSSLTGTPSTFAPAAHSHPASQISDSTVTGRAVMTATDAAAARAAIGAGTGNGSGTVTSITAGTGLSGGTITTSGTLSLANTGTAGTYSGVTTDAQGRVTAGTARSFAYQTRALNTCFQISASRDALVTYSVDIATSLSLTAGQQGTVFLRIYTDSGCSAGVQELTRFVNGQTGTLTIGLALTQNVTGTLTGVIPAGSYVQLVTQNNAGSPTYTARPGQEVLL